MNERDPLHIAGQIIAGKYQIERLVGEGGFAAVYRAQHTIWKKPVAIKFFNGLSNVPVDQREQFQDAFIQEGALLTELSSQTANIVQARDVGTFTTPDGHWVPYMVLEWLDGAPLEDVLERERASGVPPWSLSQALGLLGDVAAALDVAHGKGIAHRDIKPANLFVLGTPRSGNATVKVLDFGVAKMMSENTQLKAALAKTGMSVTSFTPQYGAPEQFDRNYGATGPWTDVYALALVTVEMMAGRTALDGDDLIQLAVSSGNAAQRPTPRRLSVLVTDAVEQVFQTALAVRPEDRYARAAEFWQALKSAADLSGIGSHSPLGTAGAATELAPSSTAAAHTLTNTSGRTTGAPSTAGAVTTDATAPRKRTALGLVAAIGVVGLALGGFLLTRQPEKDPSAGTPSEVLAGGSASAAAEAADHSLPGTPPTPSCPEEMAQIPAGQFFMGSDAKEAMENQKPSHNVALDSFCMDLYEVTAKDYKACSDSGKCRRAPNEVEWPQITATDRTVYSPLCTFADPNRLDHPINCVTWDMADTYCRAMDKRLPTEAEWEFSARGPDGRAYPWGDEEPTLVHLNGCGTECLGWAKKAKVQHQFTGVLYPADDGYPTTAPVGKFPHGRSRFGPYDVVGNVWEWVADWDAKYTSDDQKNPTGPVVGEKKVIRGGSWNGSFPSWLHPSFRYSQDPKAQSHGIGFRCAKSL